MAYACLNQAFFMNVKYLMIFSELELFIIFLKCALFMVNSPRPIDTYLKVYCIWRDWSRLISAIH